MFVLRYSCLCAFFLFHVLLSMFMPRSIYSCDPCHVCVQIYMLDAMPCAFLAFLSLVMHFSCLLTLRQGVDLDLVVQAQIHTPWPISKGLDHFFYACVCLFASMLCVYVYLARFRFLPCFVPFVGLCLLVFGPICFMIASFPFVAYCDEIACEIYLHDVGLLEAYLSLLCAIICLPCLLCAPVCLSSLLCIFALLPTCSCMCPCVCLCHQA